MEGVILYIMLVQVFTHTDWKYYTAFALISYGKATAWYIWTFCSYWELFQVGHYCTWYCVFHWDWQDQTSGVMGVMMCKLFYAIKAATLTSHI